MDMEKRAEFDFKAAITQQEQEFNGTWRRGETTGVEFRMRPATYPGYRRRVDKLQRQYRKDNRMLTGKKALEPVPLPVLRRIVVQAACEELITDWRNIVNGPGEPIPFAPMTAFEAAAKVEKLADDIFELVGDDELEDEDSAEELSGNLPRRSDTSPAGAP